MYGPEADYTVDLSSAFARQAVLFKYCRVFALLLLPRNYIIGRIVDSMLEMAIQLIQDAALPDAVYLFGAGL